MSIGEGVELSREMRGETIWDTTSSHFSKTMDDVFQRLNMDHLKVQNVGSLGVGLFPEAKALVEYFPEAKVVGFDREVRPALLDKTSGVLPGAIELVKGDLTDEDVYRDQRLFDVMVVRNPNILSAENGWRRIFSLASKRINRGGILIATASVRAEIEKVERAIEDVGMSVVIEEENKNSIPKKIPGVFRDEYLLVATK